MLYAAFIAALVLGYETLAERHREQGRSEVRAEFAIEAQAADSKRDNVSRETERRVVERIKEVQVITETITKEIPVYVYPTDPSLPGRFRVLHDAAASGEVPDPAAVDDATPIPAEDLAETIIANYGTCRANAARLTEWNAWATEQQSAR